jgi:hypothetical protein
VPLVSSALVRHVVRHPGDGLTLLRAGWHLRRRQWWRYAPFLPLPDRDYWRFRLVTAEGAERLPSPRAMVDAAKWSLAQGRHG